MGYVSISYKASTHPPPAIFQALVIYITIALPLLWFVHFDRGILQAVFLLLLLVVDFVLVLVLQKNRLGRIVCTAAVVLWICAAIVVCAFLLGRSLLGSYGVFLASWGRIPFLMSPPCQLWRKALAELTNRFDLANRSVYAVSRLLPPDTIRARGLSS